MANSTFNKSKNNLVDGIYAPRNYWPNAFGSVNTAGAELYSDTQTATMTIASPAVVTVTSTTNFYVGMPLIFTTTGALPTGVTSGTTYYVRSIDSGTTFKFSATLGGSNVNTSGSQSGTHTFRPLVPLDATGGTASGLTFSSSSSSPIRFDANYSLVQTNSTIVAGQGISWTLDTFDSADLARTMTVMFDFNASSTFVASSGAVGSDSDLKVFVYDATNSVLIPVTPAVITANGSNSYTFAGTFQTSSSGTSYRIALHASTNSANATGWTFKVSNGYVGPQIVSKGAPISDWIAYTPTLGSGFGTATNVSFFYARNGDTLLVKGSFTTGTTAASLGSITLPSGLALDTAKVSIANTTSNPGAQVGNFACPNANYYGPIVTATGTSTTLVYIGDQIANSAKLTPQNINVVIGSTVVTSVNFSVPIVGWSSNVVMSNDTDTRVVAARYHIGSAAAMTSGNIINWEVKDIDTHNAVTTGVGAWRFTAPVSGIYSVSGCYYANAGTGLWLYKNGSNYSFLANSITTTYLCPVGVSTLVSLNAGDYIDARINGSATPVAQGSLGDSVGTENWVSIQRLSGPATIAATDTVAARYHITSAASTTANTQINYETKDFDTHGAVTTGVGAWKFICPVSGLYYVAATNYFGSTSSTINIYKNGSIYSSLATSVSNSATNGASDLIRLVAGDYIDIRTENTVTPTSGSSPLTVAGSNHVSINRVGN